MGVPIFGSDGIDLAQIIADQLGPRLIDATLVKVTPGTPTPGNLTGGTNPTTTSYACRGMIDTQSVRFQHNTAVRDDRKRIMLLGNTIDSGSGVAPEPGDRIIIEGATYVIPEGGTVDRDPAAATYTFDVATY